MKLIHAYDILSIRSFHLPTEIREKSLIEKKISLLAALHGELKSEESSITTLTRISCSEDTREIIVAFLFYSSSSSLTRTHIANINFTYGITHRFLPTKNRECLTS